MFRRKHTSLTPVGIAILCILATTMASIVAELFSRWTRGEMWIENVKYFCFYCMLFSCIGLVAALVHTRRSQPNLPEYFLWQDTLVVSPLDVQNVWILDQATMDSDLKTILGKIKSSRQRQIQVLSMRGLVIRDHIHELWQYLPNLAVLDLQDALFPDQFWLGLERCKSLDHALAHGALQPSDLKAIQMTVPELKLHLSPMTICVRR
jgi:hypothetical protein